MDLIINIMSAPQGEKLIRKIHDMTPLKMKPWAGAEESKWCGQALGCIWGFSY